MLFFSPMGRIGAMVLLAACSTTATDPDNKFEDVTDTSQYVMDTHSNALPNEAVITHMDLDITVDMVAQQIQGTASFDVQATGKQIILDTDGLTILSVTDTTGKSLVHALGDSTFLGRALKVDLPTGTKRISIAYSTGKNAKALQWLVPQQTMDKEYPFLFTQGEAILTRSWIPIQDSPGIRFTYSAKVKVPTELMAVMSAANPQKRTSDGVYTFHMDEPIPAYLVALAVGDLAFEAIDDRTGVYAERGVVKKAAWEFADTGKMLKAAEALYGPYRWGRYDVIVLPPSFPFGGMENPRLTFATPTILAGDRSLTSLVAHELAHSWSGNLVTNATWNDFWLNEGFTVYFEGRISEALYGKEYEGMLEQLGRDDLNATLKQIAESKHPEDSKLRLDLEGRNPDDGMTDVAYEKGAAFLRLLESKVGREKFDAFVREYFDTFAFQSMTTDRFLVHLDKELLTPNNVKIDINAWVDGVGLPPDAPIPVSDLFAKVDAQRAAWVAGKPAKELETKNWSAFEWMHFIRHLPAEMNAQQMVALDKAFKFTDSGNAEILSAWLEQCIRNNYSPAYVRLDQFLNTVGRRKFLIPLYTALKSTDKGRIMAQAIYLEARPNYHSVSVHTIDELLDWKNDQPPVNF